MLEESGPLALRKKAGWGFTVSQSFSAQQKLPNHYFRQKREILRKLPTRCGRSLPLKFLPASRSPEARMCAARIY